MFDSPFANNISQILKCGQVLSANWCTHSISDFRIMTFILKASALIEPRNWIAICDWSTNKAVISCPLFAYIPWIKLLKNYYITFIPRGLTIIKIKWNKSWIKFSCTIHLTSLMVGMSHIPRKWTVSLTGWWINYLGMLVSTNEYMWGRCLFRQKYSLI